MLLLPAEILQNVFSYLSYSEIYRLRRICKSWKLQCEHDIYSSIKSRQQKLTIKVGGKGSKSYIDMLPCDYDYEDQVVEFKTRSSLSEDTDKESDDDVDVPSITGNKKIQVIFSEWEEKPIDRNMLRGLHIADRTLTLFHLNYNPSLEQCYKLPKTSVRNTSRLRYIGGKGMIVCFSYIYPDTQHSQTSLPPVRIRVHYVHVNLSWIISGLDTTVSTQTLYKKRYAKLDNILNDYDIMEYPLYTEPVLQYIMMDIKKDNNDDDKKESLLVLPIENKKSRLEQLESELLSIGIDPRIIYKYTFSKSFIMKDQNDSSDHYNNAKEVAEVIQKAEEGWNKKKVEFKHHLNME